MFAPYIQRSFDWHGPAFSNEHTGQWLIPTARKMFFILMFNMVIYCVLNVFQNRHKIFTARAH